MYKLVGMENGLASLIILYQDQQTLTRPLRAHAKAPGIGATYLSIISGTFLDTFYWFMTKLTIFHYFSIKIDQINL